MYRKNTLKKKDSDLSLIEVESKKEICSYQFLRTSFKFLRRSCMNIH